MINKSYCTYNRELRKMKKNLTTSTIILLILFTRLCIAQDTVLFPGLTGNELRDSVIVYYKPQNVLTYDNARHTLYGDIYNENGIVECVYTGNTIPVDPESSTPATDAWNDYHWSSEHVYPQSKGAGSGNARSDMHNLQPIRQDVNASRSNYPFTYLSDDEVRYWWRKDVKQETIPEEHHGEWSKTKTDLPRQFEVRDAMKGNVARAMFYFYTIYRHDALATDPDYFQHQIRDLRNYHMRDPVDSVEVHRSFEKSIHQDEKPNPFVIDTTLVRRMYGIDVPGFVSTVSASESQVNIYWASNHDIMIIWNQTGIFDSPVDGIEYVDGEFALGGYIIHPADENEYFHSGLDAGEYHYKIVSVDRENGLSRYSTGLFRKAATGDPYILYYWNFNDPPGASWEFNTIPATSGNGVLSHIFETEPQAFGGTSINAQENDVAGSSFAPQGGSNLVNNKKYIELNIPTSGYENIILSYAAQRTGTGFSSHTISYSIDGTFEDEVVHSKVTTIPSDFAIITVTFVDVEEAANNPDFRVRITFDGASAANGNNRIDNLTVGGFAIPFRDIQISGGGYEMGEFAYDTDIPFYYLRLASFEGDTDLLSLKLHLEGKFDTNDIESITLWLSFETDFDLTSAEKIVRFNSFEPDTDTVLYEDIRVELSQDEIYIFTTVRFKGGTSGEALISGSLESFDDLKFCSPVLSSRNNTFPIRGTNRIVSAPGDLQIPVSTRLYQSYPNPANPGAVIQFSVEERTSIAIRLYSLLGQYVMTLAKGEFEAGHLHTVPFDGSGLSSGIYYYVLEAETKRVVKSLHLIK